MPFDLSLIKEHPYATGGIVIVGGVIVFYLLSSSQSSSAQTTATSSSPDLSAIAAADAQVAQTNAAAQVQTNAQTVQLQQAQLEADVANNQTAASLQANNLNTAATLAATLAQVQASTQQNQDSLQTQLAENADTLSAQTVQQGNELTYAQNIQGMQDAVLQSQINAGVVENANNNATALAGTEATLDYQTTLAGYQAAVASQGVTAAETVQEQQQQDQYNLSTQTLNMVQQAGLNHGTESLENDLIGTVGLALGTAQPATAAVTGNSQAAAASSAATASIISSIGKTASSVANGLLA